MSTRFLAQQISGEVVSTDLPVDDAKVKFTLSGPNSITGKFSPELVEITNAKLVPWGTWIHCEVDGVIRASGLLQPGSLEDETLSFTAEGITGYAHGTPYLGDYSVTKTDPADVVREIWRHLQSYPDGPKNITVTGTTTATVGTPKKSDDTTSGPYQLHWYENPDCGDEIGKLAQTCGFDFMERDEWNTARDTVLHYIDILFPRPSHKRQTVRFAEGENLLAQPQVAAADNYASEVTGLGSGEGSKKVRATAGKTIPGRLRRCAVVTDDTVTKQDVMKAQADIELRRRSYEVAFTQVTVAAYHTAAPLGSFQCGDLVRVVVTLPYLGEQSLWHQVTGYEYDPETERITVDVNRVDGS